jgi:hypothetical protein
MKSDGPDPPPAHPPVSGGEWALTRNIARRAVPRMAPRISSQPFGLDAYVCSLSARGFEPRVEAADGLDDIRIDRFSGKNICHGFVSGLFLN